MTEREQVIANLLYMKRDCLEGSDTDQTIDRAVKLLKEQEPRKVIGIAEFDEDISCGRCPSCNKTIVNKRSHPIRFCKFCGQEVKWE